MLAEVLMVGYRVEGRWVKFAENGVSCQGINTIFSLKIKSREDETLFGSPNTV